MSPLFGRDLITTQDWSVDELKQAIELAKTFSTEHSGKFINGMLDAIYKKLKNENKIEKKGRGLVSSIHVSN